MVLFESKEEKQRKQALNLAKSAPTTESINNIEELSPAKIESARTEIVDIRDRFREQLLASGKIDEITSQISISDQSTIIDFGKDAALRLSTVSDDVIKQYDSTNTSESSVIINRLLDIMEEIDISEIDEITDKIIKSEKLKDRKKIDRLIKEIEKKLSRVVGKYNNITKDIEDIYKELYAYETKLKNQNDTINDLYNSSVESYKELIIHVEAGKQAMIEMQDYKKQLESEQQTSGDPNIAFKISDVDNALSLMSKRINDLTTSESLALMSIPTYKIQEQTNNCLQMKLESQLITTLPALKQQIANAILTKQNAITLKGMSALDYATNKLIEQGAVNSVNQLKLAQEAANTSGIKTETLSNAWNTVINGIREYKAAEVKYEQIRQEEINKKASINEQYLNQLSTEDML